MLLVLLYFLYTFSPKTTVILVYRNNVYASENGIHKEKTLNFQGKMIITASEGANSTRSSAAKAVTLDVMVYSIFRV